MWEYAEFDDPTGEVDETVSEDLQSDESGTLKPVNTRSFRRELRYDYKYDPHGNWIERVVSWRLQQDTDFQRSNIERREIAYYT